MVLPLKESEKTTTNASLALRTSGGNPDKIDSGFESGRTEPTAKFSKDRGGMSHFSVGTIQDNTESVATFETEAPWEVFLTGRKLTIAIYSRIPRDEKPAEKEIHSTKTSFSGRSKPVLIKPVLRVELVHPALIVNTHTSGPRIQVSCFDVSVTGASSTSGNYQQDRWVALFRKCQRRH